MPQTTYLPVYRADYPILAKAQKPGGVTVLSVVTANDVPNKPVASVPTIQMVMVEGAEVEAQEESAEEAEVEEHEGSHPARRSTSKRGKKSR